MSFDGLKGKPEKELLAKMNELADENFKAKFTTEAITPAKGAQMRKRRLEIAQIKTVLVGRKRLAKAESEQKQLEAAIEAMGKPHEGTVEQKNARRKLARRLSSLKRTIHELTHLKGQ
jgi:ribosomal protein L29